MRVITIIMLVFLMACGGGGGDESEQPAPPEEITPILDLMRPDPNNRLTWQGTYEISSLSGWTTDGKYFSAGGEDVFGYYAVNVPKLTVKNEMINIVVYQNGIKVVDVCEVYSKKEDFIFGVLDMSTYNHTVTLEGENYSVTMVKMTSKIDEELFDCL